jgi:hypothetical protein
VQELVVDTNVLVVAEGVRNSDQVRDVSARCRAAVLEFLPGFAQSFSLVVDDRWEVLREYERALPKLGQPGPGKRFLVEIYRNINSNVRLILLARRPDGEFQGVAQTLIDAGFDRSDRKFVALSNDSGARIVNAVDGDWVEHRDVLEAAHISVEQLCGQDRGAWFEGLPIRP